MLDHISEGRQLSNKKKYILTCVFRELCDGARSQIMAAKLKNVEDWPLEVAVCDPFDYSGGFS